MKIRYQGRKALFVAVIIYLSGVVGVTGCWLTFLRYESLTAFDNRLLAAADALPGLLARDFHDRALDKDSISPEEDQRNLDNLSTHARIGGFAYLYTYVMNKGQIYFTSSSYTDKDVDEGKVSRYWTAYPEGDTAYSEAAGSAKPVFVTASDRWGSFRTILIPARSPAGNPYVIGVDIDISEIHKTIWKQVPWVVGAAFLLLLFAVPIAVTMRNTLISVNSELRMQLDENKKVADELFRASEKANTANKAKTHFLANMSHEIRTPMNAVIGMTSLLLDTPLNPEQNEYARIVYDSSGELLRIINDILDFSKVEAGKLDIRKEDFDLRVTLQGVRETMEPGINQKGLDFECIVDSNISGSLKGDPGRLRQVILNLLGNAAKFTERGKISLLVSIQSETRREIAVRFLIRDTGIGIKKEDQSKLFSSFNQVDAGSTRKYGGTGLGLAISKKLVELMNSKIDFVSEKGNGSEFFFTINFEKSDSHKKLKTINPLVIEGKTVLVIDNNLFSSLRIKKSLEFFECSVILCETMGHAAIHLGNGKFDYVMIADSIPGFDAEAFRPGIAKTAAEQGIPLIMIAYGAMRGDAEKAKRAGFSAFLSMPATREQIYGCLSYAHGWQAFGDESPDEKNILTRHKIVEIEKNTPRILLVEDNPINQKLALILLNKMHCIADLAENGKTAIQKLEQNQYDLVFMDVQMPEMDGLEAARIIRDKRSKVLQHDIPIVALTAHALQHDRQACLDAGMDDHITKPVKRDILEQAIKRNLRG